MAVGKTYLFTVGYTESDTGVTRPYYPLKRAYKQVVDTQFPKFPDSFEQVSASLYWFPYQDFTPLDSDYIPYTVGDEYGWADDERVRPRYIAAPNPNSRKRRNYDIGTRVVFSGEVYEATKYYFYWSDTGFDVTKNPYTTDRIVKWRKVSDTSDTWVQYWYHPLLRRFYVLADNAVIRDLPDTTLDTKWDGFTGDALELNLSNFTAAQIRTLVSKGETPSVAKTLVDRLDQTILDSITTETMPIDQLTRARNREIFGAPPALFGDYVANKFGAVTVKVANKGNAIGGPDLSVGIATMKQLSSTSDGSVASGEDAFTFQFRPNNVSYSNIGANWTEIDRVNNSPVLDFKNFKLMKISFEFVVGVNDQTQGTNLFESCEKELSLLRKMAAKPYPIVFTGFDQLFSDYQVYAPSNTGSGRWAIVDMSISSIFRVQSSPEAGRRSNAEGGNIARATVNMTIQEIPRDIGALVQFPRLPFQPPPKSPREGNDGDSGTCVRLFSDLEAIQGDIAESNKRALISECAKQGAANSKLQGLLRVARLQKQGKLK